MTTNAFGLERPASPRTEILRFADRANWLTARRLMLTASDVAAVLGLDPWKSAYTVWAEKTGRLDNYGPPHPALGIETDIAGDLESEAARWGQLLEEPVAAEVATRTRRVFLDHGRYTLFVTRELGFPLGCTPDREITAARRVACFDHASAASETCGECEIGEDARGPGLYEGKTFGTWADPENEWLEEGPPRAIVQLQVGMFVTGAKWGILAGLHGGQRLHYHEHAKIDDFLPALRDRLAEFHACVRENREPDIEKFAIDSTLETLDRIFPGKTALRGKLVELSEKSARACERLRANAEQRRILDADSAEAEAIVKAEMGDHQRAVYSALETRDRVGASVTHRRNLIVSWRNVTPRATLDCEACGARVKDPPKPYRRFEGPWTRDPR